MDERLTILNRWAAEAIGGPVDLEPASADASFRRYFRAFAGDQGTFILMDAPPDRESVDSFTRAAALFRELGLNVPEVFAADEARGFALLGDLGRWTYLQALTADNADELYADALDALWRLQSGSRSRLDAFESYDSGKLVQEMELFRQWFVPCRTDCSLSPRDHEIIDHTFQLLAASALEQPRVWVHRDYHSRNLMVTEHNNPGILDFQDAVSGPVTYDLVSLLRDCYVSWPEERVEGWLGSYFERARTALPGVGLEQFRRWFDLMGVQRHIKVLGIFSRLFHRDGKANYLAELPLVHDYVNTVCGRHRALHPFRDLLASMNVTWTS